MPFVHLHVHSSYSFLRALASPQQLCAALEAQGSPGAALTDSGSVAGFVEWFDLLEKKKMRAAVGCELWTAEATPRDRDPKIPLPGHQVVVLAQTAEGWKNLSRLISAAHRRWDFAPRTSVEDLGRWSEGLLLLTGAQHGALRDPERAEERVRALREVMGDRLWIETCETGLEEDQERNDLGRKLARQLSLPVVATNDVRHLVPEDCAVLETAMQVATAGKVEPGPGGWVLTDQAYLKTELEMTELFPKEELEESWRILDSCSFSPVRGTPMLPRVPLGEDRVEQWRRISEVFPPPAAFPRPPEQPPTSDEAIDGTYLRWIAPEGLRIRLIEHPETLTFASEEEHWARLQMELDVIVRMDYATYHLMVSEFINWSKDNGIAVGPGRGSAAGSLVCWALRITDCNPMQFGLLFERFLNPERRGLPDIDVDFQQGRREEVVAHVRKKYGADRVGQILTVGKMKAKAALKDVARTLCVNFDESDAWSKRVPEGPKVTLTDSLKDPYFQAAIRGSPLFRRTSELALRLEGTPRQFGVHAAGVIISSDPLEECCPLQRNPKDGTLCVGVDMVSAEKAGLVKFDFLGLKTLDVIQRARRSVRARTGVIPEVTDPLFDDPEVFRLCSSADTVGMFQIEFQGMIRLIRKMKPDKFSDVVALLALYRPGPIQAGMVDRYVERKHGREEPEYVHPLLVEATQETFGILVYQEQCARAARILAGFSYGEADILRKAMGKKLAKEMNSQREKFVDGCVKNGLPNKEGHRVFDLIDKFASYGFNKSHSAAYAIVTYQTAKLKAHHRADYMAAAMTHDASNRAQLRAYVADTRRAGLQVLPPDVNRSAVEFSVEADPTGTLAVRYGLVAVDGLGDAALSSILDGRAEGPYRSLRDVSDRTGLNIKMLSSLAWSGAVDSIEKSRHDAWWSVAKPAKKTSKKVAPEQLGLFSGRTRAEEQDDEDQALKPQAPSFAERMKLEADAIGVVLSDHPLRRYRDVAARIRTHSLRSCQAAQNGSPVVLAAHVESVARAKSKRDDPYVRIQLEDGEATISAVARGDVIRRIERDKPLEAGDCVRIEGVVQVDGDEIQVVLSSVELLSLTRSRISRLLEIVIPAGLGVKVAQGLSEILSRSRVERGTSLRIRLLGTDDVERIATLPHPVRLGEDELEAIDRLLGAPGSVRLPGRNQE